MARPFFCITFGAVNTLSGAAPKIRACRLARPALSRRTAGTGFTRTRNAKMTRNALKRTYGCLLLLILLSAHAGQKVHIYRENPLHFAAWAGNLVPVNGADAFVAERCVVDDFYFFPCLTAVQHVHAFYAEILAVLLPQTTRCKAGASVRSLSLRAPPACRIADSDLF